MCCQTLNKSWFQTQIFFFHGLSLFWGQGFRVQTFQRVGLHWMLLGFKMPTQIFLWCDHSIFKILLFVFLQKKFDNLDMGISQTTPCTLSIHCSHSIAASGWQVRHTRCRPTPRSLEWKRVIKPSNNECTRCWLTDHVQCRVVFLCGRCSVKLITKWKSLQIVT